MNSISPNLNIMIKAAEKASKSLIRDFGELENLQVSLKGPSDFVTSADKNVEKIIMEELSKSKKKCAKPKMKRLMQNIKHYQQMPKKQYQKMKNPKKQRNATQNIKIFVFLRTPKYHGQLCLADFNV